MVEASMLALAFGAGRTEVAETICSDIRVLSGSIAEVEVELEGRGNRFVGLGFEEPYEACTGGSIVGFAGSGFVDLVTYVFVHLSCLPSSSPPFHLTAAASRHCTVSDNATRKMHVFRETHRPLSRHIYTAVRPLCHRISCRIPCERGIRSEN